MIYDPDYIARMVEGKTYEELLEIRDWIQEENDNTEEWNRGTGYDPDTPIPEFLLQHNRKCIDLINRKIKMAEHAEADLYDSMADEPDTELDHRLHSLLDIKLLN